MLLLDSSCSKKQFEQALGEIVEEDVSTAEVESALREALMQGIEIGFSRAGEENGYFSRERLKINFPQEYASAEATLRKMGMGNELDQFILELNRSAERAALEARPLFDQVVQDMEFEDPWYILRGERDAATKYLQKYYSKDIYPQFRMIINQKLQSEGALQLYTRLTQVYNNIPLTSNLDTDLTTYTSEEAMNGLFTMMAREEIKIRQNPDARSTQLMKKVFARQ